jgi:hypothetical protein
MSEPINTPDGLTDLERQVAEASATYKPFEPILPTPTPSDWQHLADERQAEIDRLNSIITAGKLAPSTPHPQQDARPALTCEQLKARVGALNWHKMTDAEKIAGLGQNPNEIDREFLKRLFGRGNDGRTVSDLAKSSPLRLRQLREVSKALNLYAN